MSLFIEDRTLLIVIDVRKSQHDPKLLCKMTVEGGKDPQDASSCTSFSGTFAENHRARGGTLPRHHAIRAARHSARCASPPRAQYKASYGSPPPCSELTVEKSDQLILNLSNALGHELGLLPLLIIERMALLIIGNMALSLEKSDQLILNLSNTLGHELGLAPLIATQTLYKI